MPNPPLRSNYFDERTPGSNELSAAEYNLNAERTDAAYDNAINAVARSNHTGTQLASTISDLYETVQDVVAAMLMQGSNILLTYNDAGNMLTISATGGAGGATNITVTASPTGASINSDTGSDGTLPLADATNAGLMAPAQHTKLGGIATGATANATDAALRARSSHTGTQAASTISDFSEASMDAIAAALVAGANTAISYDDVSNTITVSSSGGTGFTLNPTAGAAKVASYTMAASDLVRVNSLGAAGAITLTLPSAPPDGTLVGVYIEDAGQNVTLARGGTDELVWDGAAVTTFSLYDATQYWGLSIWRYETTGAFWHLVSYSKLTRAIDIIDMSAHMRTAATAADTAGSRAALEVWKLRNVTGATSGTITPNASTTDQLNINGATGALTFAAPNGTADEGQPLLVRVKDNGTARSLTWNAAYRSGVGVILPNTTTVGKTTYVGLKYNSPDAAWDCVAVWTQA